MTTRAGTECIAHVLQGVTDLDHRATVLSIDGIGAFDSVSRASMLQGVLNLGVERPLRFHLSANSIAPVRSTCGSTRVDGAMLSHKGKEENKETR